MFLTIHASSGIFIGSQISTPWLAFLLGFVSHLIIDIIPHGDDKLGKHWPRLVKIKRLSLIVAVDMIGVILLSYYLFYQNFIDLTPSIILAIIGAILPDYIWGFHEITKDRISGWISSNILDRFHFLCPYRVSILTGIFIQLATLAIFIFLLINL